MSEMRCKADVKVRTGRGPTLTQSRLNHSELNWGLDGDSVKLRHHRYEPERASVAERLERSLSAFTCSRSIQRGALFCRTFLFYAPKTPRQIRRRYTKNSILVCCFLLPPISSRRKATRPVSPGERGSLSRMSWYAGRYRVGKKNCYSSPSPKSGIVAIAQPPILPVAGCLVLTLIGLGATS